jgi:DNA-binding transcriptional MerR regulator
MGAVRIGELVRRSGVAAPLLRYYEAQGLLRPERDANGYRRYGEDAVTVVGQIRGLLEAGLSTREIRQLLPCARGAAPVMEPCPEVLDLLHGRLDKLDRSIGSLVSSRTALQRYLRATEGAARAG